MINKLIYGLKNPKKSFEFVKKQIYLRKIKKGYHFQNEPKKLSFYIKSIRFSISPDKNIIDSADKILSGHLKIYSSTNIKVQKLINWHKDYISNYIWSKNKFFSDIQYKYPTGTDIKNPWEISRFQQMATIGLAYKKTKNEKYAKYFVNQVNDWIKQNPVYHGINWLCTMEVAIRACNWLLAYNMLRDSKYLNNNSEFYKIFCGSIYEHGKYIFHNLENLGVKSNHYISDLVGLIWIGILCPKMPNSQRGLKLALKEFEKEILHQFYKDGVNFEASTSYHRLVLEMIAYTIILCQNNNIKFNEEFYKRLQKAFEYSYYYFKTNNNAPQFGDNDSGRFLILNDYFSWDSLNHKYLLKLAQKIYPKIKLFKSRSKNYIKWFNQGKVLIINRWNWYLAINASPIGQDNNGGHAHNDTGSFELSYKNEDFIVDSGSFTYTSNSKERNKFRSIDSHSVFAIKNQEFNKFVKDNLFTLKNSGKPRVSIKKNLKEIIIRIKYFNGKLSRIFKISQKNIKIIDKINKNYILKNLIENLILDTGVQAKINKNYIILSRDEANLKIIMCNPKIKTHEISKAYNHKLKSKKITNVFQKESVIQIWKK